MRVFWRNIRIISVLDVKSAKGVLLPFCTMLILGE